MPLNLRVVTWNVHKCVGGLDRRYDPARTCAVLESTDADVILLQEVSQGGHWYKHERQVDVLGDALGLSHRSYFVNVKFGPKRGEYGNAILSRYPITSTDNIDLTVASKKARSALHAEVRVAIPDGGARTVHAFNLHLGLGERERREQLRMLMAHARMTRIHDNTPIVIAGDFNDVLGNLGKRLLAPAGFRGPRRAPRTFPAWAPLRALDSLFVRGECELQSLTSARSKGSRTASDHVPLIANLELQSRGG